MEEIEGSERVGWVGGWVGGEAGQAGNEVRANLCRNCLGGRILTNLEFGSEFAQEGIAPHNIY